MNLIKDLQFLRKLRLKEESKKAQLRSRSKQSNARPTVEELNVKTDKSNPEQK